VRRLLLARHGQSVSNAVRRFQGAQDVALSPLGVRQAEALGLAVERRRVAHVYASPLERARRTAEIAGAGSAVPDRAGALSDIVLGFENLDGYTKGGPYFGAIVGRVANRIKDAEFTLEGKRYALDANDKPNHLHGGKKGWDKVVWTANAVDTARGPALELTYIHSNARLEDKHAFLYGLKSGGTKYLRIIPTERQAHVMGNVAVFTGVAAVHAIDRGQDLDITIRYTNVHVLRDGRWQIVAGHSSRIPETPK